MATHSSLLAWRILGQRSLEGYSPWGCKESDTTEQVTLKLLVEEDHSIHPYWNELNMLCSILTNTKVTDNNK